MTEKHTCHIGLIIKRSETKTDYVCPICQRVIGYSDESEFGVDIVVYLDLDIDEDSFKVYPKGEQAKYDKSTLKQLV